jgi:hypothetical protein
MGLGLSFFLPLGSLRGAVDEEFRPAVHVGREHEQCVRGFAEIRGMAGHPNTVAQEVRHALLFHRRNVLERSARSLSNSAHRAARLAYAPPGITTTSAGSSRQTIFSVTILLVNPTRQTANRLPCRARSF